MNLAIGLFLAAMSAHPVWANKLKRQQIEGNMPSKSVKTHFMFHSVNFYRLTRASVGGGGV
jgi:hypothetical protein